MGINSVPAYRWSHSETGAASGTTTRQVCGLSCASALLRAAGTSALPRTLTCGRHEYHDTGEHRHWQLAANTWVRIRTERCSIELGTPTPATPRLPGGGSDDRASLRPLSSPPMARGPLLSLRLSAGSPSGTTCTRPSAPTTAGSSSCHGRTAIKSKVDSQWSQQESSQSYRGSLRVLRESSRLVGRREGNPGSCEGLHSPPPA